MEIINSSKFFDNELFAAYKMLALLPVERCVDVGAAAGDTVGLMKRYSPNALIDAFEPFPGNIPLFHENMRAHSGVRLFEGAVSAQSGKAQLQVAATVKGTEPGWESRVGYSSGSRLATDASTNTIEIECFSIDEVCDYHINFLKIDVQGTERDVLESARTHFQNSAVDMCYIELDGNRDVIEFLDEFNFHIITTPILISAPEPVERPGFTLVDTKPMSNGLVASVGWDETAPSNPFDFADHIRSLKPGPGQAAQTDLICVSPSYWDEYLFAAKKFRIT